MKSIELLVAIGEVKNEYIQDILFPIHSTQKGTVSRNSLGSSGTTGMTSKKKSDPKKHNKYLKNTPKKRFWLIAAIVALTLLLVGCAVVYVLSLTGMKIGQTTHVEPEHYGPNWVVIEETQTTYDVLSVQSFSDSPNQRATREWIAYRDTFDTDYFMEIPDEVRRSVPDTYSSYGCWTPEMMEKLDEIAQKYNLKLLEESMGTNQDYVTIVVDTLKLHNLLRQQSYADIEIKSAGIYQHGSYHLGLRIVLDDSFNWPYNVLADLHYSTRGYFDDYTITVRNLETIQEWEYTLPNGGTALLALDEETALILVEGEEGFFAMDFDSQMGIDRVTPEMMERIADLFDFSMIPYRPTDEEWTSAKTTFYAAEEKDRLDYNAWLEANRTDGQRDNYDEWVRQTLENGNDIASLGYAFYDIDGNGVNELLIGRDGYCEAIFWERDGKTEQFANAAENLYVCEDGKIVYVMMPGQELYYFTQMENGASRGMGSVQYTPGNPEGEYRTSDPEKWGVYNYITKEEYDATLSSYVRIPIQFVPLVEYPLDEPVKLGSTIHVYTTDYTSYEEMIRIRLTSQEERWSRWAYDILDLDGDGRDEMIWREDDRYSIYTIVDGTVCCYNMIYDGTITVSGNGIVQAVVHYGPENYTIRFYRLNSGKIELVDYLRYDVDIDQQNKWFHSSDLTGQDFTLEHISEMEAKSIIASYDPIEISMTPIADYPFS